MGDGNILHNFNLECDYFCIKNNYFSSTIGTRHLEFTCPVNHFDCIGARRCIHMSKLCNGINDCVDGLDEGYHCRGKGSKIMLYLSRANFVSAWCNRACLNEWIEDSVHLFHSDLWTEAAIWSHLHSNISTLLCLVPSCFSDLFPLIKSVDQNDRKHKRLFFMFGDQ